MWKYSYKKVFNNNKKVMCWNFLCNNCDNDCRKCKIIYQNLEYKYFLEYKEINGESLMYNCTKPD